MHIHRYIRNLILSFTSLLIYNGGMAQNAPIDDYYGSRSIRYENYIYTPSIRTVQLHSESHALSQPIIQFNSQEKLKLSFDDLDADYKNYAYTFIHCNSNWEPSNLQPNEYIDGFQDILINDYQFSSGSLQKYIHYSAIIPDESSRIILSGNYVLKVYQDGNPEKVIITKRFMVFENRIDISATIRPASDIAYQNYNQEIDFIIKHSDYRITNPYSDLKIVIAQNNRWDNVKTDLQPLFVKDGELVYNLSRDNVFPGGSEFRNINIKSIRFKSDRIANIKADSSLYHIYIYPDEKRSFKNYEFDNDINGQYLIKLQGSVESEIEADYCIIHFFLPLNDPSIAGNLYVFGAYNDWKCNRENMLHYSESKKGYEASILLKQGYYNYEYAYIKNGSKNADVTFVEGTHFETENNYTIYVYHTQRGAYSEQLIGIKHINSTR